MLFERVPDHETVPEQRPLVLECIPDVNYEGVDRLTWLWQRHVVYRSFIVNVDGISVSTFNEELFDAL